VSSNSLPHALTHNLGLNGQPIQWTTYTMSCLVSRMVWLCDSLICVHKNEYYELHGKNSYNICEVISWNGYFTHKVVVSRSNTVFLSPRSLSSTSSKKILRGTAWDDLWDWWHIAMYLLLSNTKYIYHYTQNIYIYSFFIKRYTTTYTHDSFIKEFNISSAVVQVRMPFYTIV
jgi:hypothetical protein